MSPDEVIERLKQKGVEISRRTLLRYEEAGLISEPQRGGLGRGRGRTTDYPNDVVAEVLTVFYLKNKYSQAEIAEGRKKALELVNDFYIKIVPDFINLLSEEQIIDTVAVFFDIEKHSFDWLMTKTKIENEIELTENIIIEYVGYYGETRPDKPKRILKCSQVRHVKMPILYYSLLGPEGPHSKEGLIAFAEGYTSLIFIYTPPFFEAIIQTKNNILTPVK